MKNPISPSEYEKRLTEKFAYEFEKFKSEDFALDAVMKIVDEELGIIGSDISRQLRSRLVDAHIFAIIDPIRKLVGAGMKLASHNGSCACFLSGHDKVLMHERKDSVDNGIGECSWCLDVKKWEDAVVALPESMKESSE
jgi:hypothetical protein